MLVLNFAHIQHGRHFSPLQSPSHVQAPATYAAACQRHLVKNSSFNFVLQVFDVGYWNVAETVFSVARRSKNPQGISGDLGVDGDY
jgi:hypothetical protein